MIHNDTQEKRHLLSDFVRFCTPRYLDSVAAQCRFQHDIRMGTVRDRSSAPDLFAPTSARRPSAPSAKVSLNSPGPAAHSSPRHVLPADLPKAITRLSDQELDQLLTAVLAEQKRRRRKLSVSNERKQLDNIAPIPLTIGQVNAVRAAFKAGITPSRELPTVWNFPESECAEGVRRAIHRSERLSGKHFDRACTHKRQRKRYRPRAPRESESECHGYERRQMLEAANAAVPRITPAEARNDRQGQYARCRRARCSGSGGERYSRRRHSRLTWHAEIPVPIRNRPITTRILPRTKRSFSTAPPADARRWPERHSRTSDGSTISELSRIGPKAAALSKKFSSGRDEPRTATSQTFVAFDCASQAELLCVSSQSVRGDGGKACQ